MRAPRWTLGMSADRLEAGFRTIREELDVPDEFEEPVAAEAAEVSPRLDAIDRRDLALVTVDPEGSLDLDQAFTIERRADGHRVFYAIADVASFVVPGSLVDLEAHRRGATLYSPDHRAPLHPAALSEGSASLLPGLDRPAVLWTLDLDDAGRLVDTHVERALVRSREQLTYVDAERRAKAGDELFTLLGEVGRARLDQGRSRGAVHLALPDQEIDQNGDGSYRLSYRTPLDVEHWNAELSLLTGMAAAALMVESGRGVLRTLPAARPGVVDRLRRTASALDLPWPKDATASEVLGHLSATTPEEAALLTQAARLFRGAGYLVFDGGVPDESGHSAIGGHYAHVTAPLRRLVDRYATELCLASQAGTPAPQWVDAGLAEIASVMGRAGSKAGALERAVVDFVEAVVLEPLVGSNLRGTVVDHRKDSTVVQFRSPAVIEAIDGRIGDLGDEIDVQVHRVDAEARQVEFVPI